MAVAGIDGLMFLWRDIAEQLYGGMDSWTFEDYTVYDQCIESILDALTDYIVAQGGIV